MKLIKASEMKFVPASHEDPKNPGVYKKVLAVKDDLVAGHIQMINWAKLPVGKSFEAHYHEDMEEIFILLSGRAEMTVDDETETLRSGDTVIVPIKAVHLMKNVGEIDVEYIVVGNALGTGGKTINT